jgi:predicted nucleic acid-binding protein
LTRRVVCDASALVALILGPGPDGAWVSEAIGAALLAAPSLGMYEAANIVRRHEAMGFVTSAEANRGHTWLLGLPINQWPYGMLAARAWDLRHNLTVYDASYVALAELLGATLITLDRGIARAPGLRCEVATPA